MNALSAGEMTAEIEDHLFDPGAVDIADAAGDDPVGVQFGF
jgi:hypothetical protein